MILKFAYSCTTFVLVLFLTEKCYLKKDNFDSLQLALKVMCVILSAIFLSLSCKNIFLTGNSCSTTSKMESSSEKFLFSLYNYKTVKFKLKSIWHKFHRTHWIWKHQIMIFFPVIELNIWRSNRPRARTRNFQQMVNTIHAWNECPTVCLHCIGVIKNIISFRLRVPCFSHFAPNWMKLHAFIII